MRQKSGPEKQAAEDAIRDIRRATRRHFSAEERIRIVLEGLRDEESSRAPPPLLNPRITAWIRTATETLARPACWSLCQRPEVLRRHSSLFGSPTSARSKAMSSRTRADTRRRGSARKLRRVNF
jgi:hypothetical protein